MRYQNETTRHRWIPFLWLLLSIWGTSVWASPTFVFEDLGHRSQASDNQKEQTPLLSEIEQPAQVCAIRCAVAYCQRLCSLQQRCYASCTPQGQASCICAF